MGAIPEDDFGAWLLPESAAIQTVVQPIVRLDDRVVIGYEALARVRTNPLHPPDWWLSRAAEAGVRDRLEVAFLDAAVRLGSPPADALLFVNASPAALAEPALLALRSALPERLVVEITEQAAVDDYAALKAHLEPWISNRVRLAIDDTGAGYSSLRHVVELSPDFLKLDRSLVHDIDKDPNRQAVVRALVAFAREVGTSVIAEGVETAAEHAELCAADVPLAQGYLLGRPAPAWPRVDPGRRRTRRPDRGRDAGLRGALAAARDAQQACDAVVAQLFREGQVMPSLYLEHHGQLRCVAQRGLWQVLDGLPANAGITGRVWATGRPIVVDRVAASSDYLEAVPGVVAEACVPVSVDGVVVGALNIDSLCPLPADALARLTDSAALLARRLGTMGWRPDDSPWQRAVRGSVALSGLAADTEAAAKVLAILLVASTMDSAALVVGCDGDCRVELVVGPLAAAFRSVSPQHLASLCGLVDRLSSCYTGRETTGLAYLGSETLRAGGARAVVLLPLRANNDRLGTIILAHSRPMRLDADVVEPLELLAAQAAAALNAIGLVERLQHQARHDGLTGLRNRLAFDEALDRVDEPPATVLIADLDDFKHVNDRYGHLAGDEALRALAEELRVRLPSVPFYRFGGDEIACLIPGDDPDTASLTAEIVCGVGRHVLARWDTCVSVGVAVPAPGESRRETLARADSALMSTKTRARGHVTTAALRAEGAAVSRL